MRASSDPSGHGSGTRLAGARVLLAVLLAASAAVPLGLPRPALAQSADEEAALILYESGRDRFKDGDLQGAVKDLEKAYSLAPNQFVRYYLALSLAGLGRCDDAAPHLQALAGTLKGEQEAARAEAAAGCDLSRAEALSGKGDCAGTNRILAALPSPLPPELATRRGALAGRCELQRAAKDADAGHCADVLPEVEALDATMLAPDNAKAREVLLQRCRVAILGFNPVTAAQKAAAILVQEGLGLQKSGREADAAIRYEKALRLYDDPTIRLKAARARVASGACAEGLAHAEAARKAGMKGIDAEMAELKAWCDTFAVPADAPLAPDVRRSLQDRYRAALQAGDAGLPDLVQTLKVYDQPRVRLYAGRRLVALGRFEEAIPVLEGAAGRLPADRGKEVDDLLALARFAMRDGNKNPDKAALFAVWSRAHAMLGTAREAEAEDLLTPIDRNPMVALDLATIAARRGQCDAARQRLEQAAKGVTMGDEWRKGLLDQCGQVAERIRKEKARAAAEAAAAARAGQARVRRIASYVLWAAGAAAAGAGGYFAWAYADARSDVIAKMRVYDRVSGGDATAARHAVASAQDRARMQIYLGAGMGVASAALVAGGVVTWFQARALGTPARVSVVPLFGVGTGGLALRGGF